MDEITRERSKAFIDQAMNKTSQASADTKNGIQSLDEIYTQYAEVIKDLLEAKSKYISIVEKYLQENPVTSAGNYFPGLIQTAAQFSQTEMQVDSQEMEQMASLVKDLETQQESLKFQLENVFRKTVDNIQTIETLSLQTSNYLDDMISDVGEIYGSASMSQLIQKSSI